MTRDEWETIVLPIIMQAIMESLEESLTEDLKVLEKEIEEKHPHIFITKKPQVINIFEPEEDNSKINIMKVPKDED